MRCGRAHRALTLALVALGLYYAVPGTVSLLTVSDVTARLIERSGGPDFRYDVGVFTALIAAGSVALASLESATAVRAYRDLTGRPRKCAGWGGLFVAAVLVHVPAFFYRVIAGGTLGPDGFPFHVLTTAGRVLVTCALYGMAWGLAVRNARTRLPHHAHGT